MGRPRAQQAAQDPDDAVAVVDMGLGRYFGHPRCFCIAGTTIRLFPPFLDPPEEISPSKAIKELDI
jgi:hypothetical protein